MAVLKKELIAWNVVIPRGEIQNNPAVVNNPDPSGKITPWTDK